jgi:hypothetical protein
MRNVCLVEKSQEKIPFWRPTQRWEDNIKMDLRMPCPKIDS